jgi:hypothetical protein
LLEARGFKKARDISREIDELKANLRADNVKILRDSLKLIN